MKKITGLFVLVLVARFITSCEADDVIARDVIPGNWTVETVTLFGSTIDDGESTITFNNCGSFPCTGSSSANNEAGMITWTLNTVGDSLTINDLDGAQGGSWSGKYLISRIKAKSMGLETTSVLGNFGFTLEKN